MLVRGSNGLEIVIEDQVASAMIAAGIVEAVEDVEDPEPAPAKTKK